jgi:hypothetical protein
LITFKREEYYAKLLNRFNNDLKKLAKKKFLFHQDNARVQICLVSMAKCHELLPYLLYSSDLALNDYFLFLNLKKWLGGKRFDSNDEIISQTNNYFEDLDKSYFLERIKTLEKRWTKCIELKRDYVEK